jgi:arylsulfatase A-like enzyme
MKKLLFATLFLALHAFSQAAAKPNVVVIFMDDMGYGDLGCFGSKTIRTPNIDRLAKEGRKFTNFLVASPVCTPSRTALLTGCYPKRVGMHQHVLFPTSTKGLHPDENTIADHLKSQGYATSCIGKWHLGHHPEVLPTAQGFDSYFGIPYSNDMNHPDNEGRPKGGHEGMDALWNDPESTLTKWRTPLYENEKIIELPVDQRTITRRYTQRAIDFVKANATKPFFLYLPHSMPHIPLYVPDDVRDPDPKKAYINTIEHIDTEVGKLLTTLDELNLSDNTYVIFTSDNGPWLPFQHHGGSAGPLRDGKGTTFEGGQRVPFLLRGPNVPTSSVCDEIMSTIDILPTLAAITNKPLPADKKIDGLDVTSLWTGTAKESPRNEFLYYTGNGAIDGIRVDQWKLLTNRANAGGAKNQKNAAPNKKTPAFALYDLTTDIGEKTDLSKAQPEVVARLRARMLELDAEVTKNARPTWQKP